MAVTVEITSVTIEPSPSSRILVNFADGTQLEFQSREELAAMVDELGSDGHLARRLLISQGVAKDPRLENTRTLLEGKRLTLDPTQVDPIKVSNTIAAPSGVSAATHN